MAGSNNSMNDLFKDAYERRRNKEFVLTSRLTNRRFDLLFHLALAKYRSLIHPSDLL